MSPHQEQSLQDEGTRKLGKKWPELTILTPPTPGAPGWIFLKAAGNRESSFVAAEFPLPETIPIQELLQNAWEGELWDVEGKHLMV